MNQTSRVVSAAVLLVAAAPASANIGVPMVAVFLPPLWLSLIPVILVEAWVLSKRLGLNARSSISGAALGNLASTLVGIPFMWVVMASFQLAFAGEARGLSTLDTRIYAVTVQAPWLIPYDSEIKWMIPIALIVLAIPAYCLSVAVEWLCLKPFATDTNGQKALGGVAVANACSYGLLAVLFAGTLAIGQSASRAFAVFEPVTMGLAEAVFSAAGWLIGQPAR